MINTWTITASLTGDSFYENAFFVGAVAPTEADYVSELELIVIDLSGVTGLSGFSYKKIATNTLEKCRRL